MRDYITFVSVYFFNRKKKEEVVMNDVFTKVVKLCVEAKVSMRNGMSATLNPALTAFQVMTREGHV